MRYLFLLFGMMGLFSCAPSLSYYTEKVHHELGRHEGDLKDIQFYISRDIVLWRDVSSGTSVVSNGKIKMVEGRRVEEVIIEHGTPGVFLFSPKKDQYAIGFDPNDDSKFLVFAPSSQMNGRYVLLAKEWGRSFGKVSYGDQVYKTSAESAYSYLMADIKRAQRTKITSTKESGRRVK